MCKHNIFRFNVREQLPHTEDDSRAHIQRLTVLLRDEEQRVLFDHLYENLSILDAKAASLLQFNSVLLAVFTLFLTDKIHVVAFYIGAVGILVTLISCYKLLEVVWVHWSTKDHMTTPENHGLKLLEVRKSRTIIYRTAWNYSKAAVVSLIVMVVLIVIARFV
jgi:hypothetical protein